MVSCVRCLRISFLGVALKFETPHDVRQRQSSGTSGESVMDGQTEYHMILDAAAILHAPVIPWQTAQALV